MSNPSLGGLAGHPPLQLQLAVQSQNSLPAGGIDPRTGGPSLTPAQIQQFNSLPAQQRQLFLMQQQQQQQQQQLARSSGINTNPGAGGLINQQFGGGGSIAANLPMGVVLLHQRQQHQQQQQHQHQQQQQARLQQQAQQAQQQPQLSETPPFTGGVPVGNSSGIPGIARSTRSPSDSTHSPLTPRGPSQHHQQQQQHSQGMDYQRTLMMQATQGQVNSPASGGGFVNAQQVAGAFGAGVGATSNAAALANGSYSVSPPGSAHSRTSFPGTASAPSPSAATSGNWQTGGAGMGASGGWQGGAGAGAGMGGGIGGGIGLDPGAFSYGSDGQGFGTDGLAMDSMDSHGIEFNDIFNMPG
ncbi:hypothetical protein B0F90DRAFT_1716581 [Multifurca ochricompacta]|uniref:Uncharacterized protein n=1 Tax=Multifurca ochricompacta TaxID=376703 RepID=A0AAD4M6G4_9AGAM|nr:hypothetical protein B0F90DRAFT_1716581 [Multifurca ochricompacta]